MPAQLDLLAQGARKPITLWPFQERAVEGILRELENNPILVSPTASGKTVMGCAVMNRLHGRILWLADAVELIEQAAEKVIDVCGEQPGFIKAGFVPDPTARIQIASKQTLINRNMPPADYVFVDECHGACSTVYQRILEHYRGQGARLIGLTATPFRLDGKGLKEPGFGAIVVAAEIDELATQGFVHLPKVYVGQCPDMTGVRQAYGDYVMSDLATRVRESGLAGDIVNEWHAKAAGRRTVAFAVDLAHSKDIVAAFQAAGVPAEHIDGDTQKHERKNIADRLRSGQTLLVSNVGVWTQGTDIPELEVGIIARPTASLCLHRQMIGRLLRMSHGKPGCIVLDHAGNHYVHGSVSRRLEYSLDGISRRDSEPLGLRRCEGCHLLFDNKLPRCPECGQIVPPPKRRKPAISGDGELAEFVEGHDFRATFYAGLVRQALDMNFSDGWIAHKFKDRFNEYPVAAFGVLVDPKCEDKTIRAEVFKQFAAFGQERGFKPGWASYRYKDFFGCWPTGFVSETRAAIGLDKQQRAKVLDKWRVLTGEIVIEEDEDLF